MEWTPEKVAEMLNRLPMVAWDRSIHAPVGDEGDEMLIVYGWIERDDVLREGAVLPGGYDYVQIEFGSWTEEVGFSTSSARHSEEMNRLIYGVGARHFPCVRLADTTLAALVNRLVPWEAETE